MTGGRRPPPRREEALERDNALFKRLLSHFAGELEGIKDDLDGIGAGYDDYAEAAPPSHAAPPPVQASDDRLSVLENFAYSSMKMMTMMMSSQGANPAAQAEASAQQPEPRAADVVGMGSGWNGVHSKMEEKDAEIRRLEYELASQGEELAAARGEIAGAEQRADQAEATATHLREVYASLSENSMEVTKRLHQAQATIAEQGARLKDLEGRLAERERRQAVMEEENRTLRIKLDELIRRFDHAAGQRQAAQPAQAPQAAQAGARSAPAPRPQTR